jgi:hypothetical protein
MVSISKFFKYIILVKMNKLNVVQSSMTINEQPVCVINAETILQSVVSKNKPLFAKFFGIFVVSTVLFFSSCKDENVEFSTPSVPQAQEQAVAGGVARDVVNPANPANPYDHYGYHHNAAIDYYIAKRSYFGSSYESIIGEVEKLTSEYFRGSELSSTYSVPNGSFTSDHAKTLSDDITKDCILRYLKHKTIDIKTVDEIISKTRQWEERIAYLASTSPERYPDADVKILYTSTSVLRHSIYYWYNNFTSDRRIVNKYEFDKIEIPVDTLGVPLYPPQVEPL